MSKERPQPPRRPRPADEFGLTRQEQLWDRVSHERVLGFLQDETTQVHRIEESYNNYGEFLFVWTSRPGQERRIWVTFYGLGYHEHRERWMAEEWFWYQGNPLPEKLQQALERDEVLGQVQQRLAEIKPRARRQTQSGRGKLFEMIANLTDEDGALTELDDLGDMADWLSDELE